MYESLRSYCRYMLPVITFLAISLKLNAQTETLPSGSFIINMGATNPNTVANGLKPYGLIYDLMRNYNVPVKWVISPTKVKDGVDFTYNGASFKGGTFIIPAQFRTVAVNSRITYWTGLGVVGVTTVSALTVDVTTTLKTIPRWTLDAANGSIAEGYLINAGITNAAFPGAYNWKAPQTLDCCDDFFVMPHADPTWATHSRLYSWNKDCLGSVWAACHAVSALENAINPANSTQQMNFLSTRTASTTPTPWPNNALKLWGTHSGGSVPYINQLPSDPVAQFMGSTELAQLNGSEQIYIPKQSTDAGGATRWNPGAKIISYDPSQASVPSPDLANGNVAAAIVYGRAFDDITRGFVMYEAGHSHNRGSVADVAAQRAFLNFSFFQVLPKAPQLNITGISSGQMVQTGSNINGLNVVASSPLAGVTFSYQWSSSCGGVFSNPTGTTTNFTAPAVAVPTVCLVVCKVTDNCSRVSYQSFPITVIPPPVAPTPQNDNKTIGSSCTPGVAVSINVLANDTDPQGAAFTFTSLAQPGSPANAGTWSSSPAGIVTFAPDPNFSGTATNTYTVTNSFGGTASATITINVGTTDIRGCLPNEIWGIANSEVLTVAEVVSNTGAIAAMTNGNANDPRLDDNESLFSSSSNTIGDFVDLGISSANLIDLQLPYALNIGDTIVIRWGKRTTAGTTVLSMLQSVTNTFSGTATNYTITGTGNLPTTTRYPVLSNGINYIRVRVGTGTTQQLYIDALDFEEWSCVSRKPQAANDAYVVLEDVPTVFSVLDNDSDPTGSGMKITEISSAPTNGGKVSINNNGTITFVSGNDLAGTSVFSYRICNAEGYCNTASVTVSITADGCPAGQYRPNPPGGAVTKTFQYQFAGANAATSNSIVTNFKDSYIDVASPTANKGTINKHDIGKIFSGTKSRRGIYFFNTSEIPTSAIVQSANFSLLRVSGDGNTQTINLQRLTRAFTENQVTWNIVATGTNWTTPGGDFTGILSSAIVTSINQRYNWDVSGSAQLWVNTPANNFGVILKTNELLDKRHQFSTKEDGTSSKRPMLSVTYVVPDPCIAIPNRNPLANPDNASTDSKTAVTIAALTNDTDPDPAQAVSLLSIGTVTNGSALISGSNIIFTPTTGFNGIATVIYNIQDNGTGNLQDQAIIYITVTNADPVAINDLPAGVNSGTVQVINIGSNDSDPEGAALTYTIYRDAKNISSPTTISTLPSTLTYTPAPGFTGTDTVFYYIEEPTSGCSNGARDSAYVVFTVLNRVPTANNDSKNILPCQTTKIILVSNDTDPEGNTLSVSNISALSNPAAGTLLNNNDGSATFTPATGFVGIVSFTYTVTDDGNTPKTSLPAQVTITVAAGANNPPVAANDVADQSNMDELVYQSVLDNDFDQDDNALTMPVITVNPIHGTAIVLMNGLIEYTPNPGFYGTDQLTYSICDIVLNPANCVSTPTLCDPAIVTFTVVAPNSVLAGNDENSTWINTPVSGATLTNDYDPQGDYPISFLGFIIGGISYTGGTHTVSGFDATGAPVANAGTITINASGTYTYSPANNFTGVVTIPYSIRDANINAAYDTADLSITVNALPGVANSVIANNDENKVFGGAVVSSTLFSNDRDPQGNLFTVTAFQFDSNGDGTADASGTVGSSVMVGGKTTSGKQTANAGTITINANGTYTFTPHRIFTAQRK
ncbi:MAG: Ig-like domain-containing protein [Ferruginibacter sp.]